MVKNAKDYLHSNGNYLYLSYAGHIQICKEHGFEIATVNNTKYVIDLVTGQEELVDLEKGEKHVEMTNSTFAKHEKYFNNKINEILVERRATIIALRTLERYNEVLQGLEFKDL